MATVNCVISSGQSLSAAANISSATLYAIIAPAAWDKAFLTIQISPDGTTFYDLSPTASDQLTVIPVVPGHCVPIGADFPKNVQIKLRSGHPVAPVVQTADRTFILLTS